MSSPGQRRRRRQKKKHMDYMKDMVSKENRNDRLNIEYRVDKENTYMTERIEKSERTKKITESVKKEYRD